MNLCFEAFGDIPIPAAPLLAWFSLFCRLLPGLSNLPFPSFAQAQE
jgi:hypothetical protein